MSSRCFSRILSITAMAVLSFYSLTIHAQLKLEAHPVSLKKGIILNLKIPTGYHISVAAEGMRRLRFLSKSPDGRLFCTDMHSLADNKVGKIYIFSDWDNTSKSFKKITTFAEKLHNPNQVMFYADKGKNYIYIAETDKLSRYEFHDGDTVLSGQGQVLTHFPGLRLKL